jgi:hypothetical protein
MTSTRNEAAVIDFKTKKRINGCVRVTLASLESENTLIADTPNVLLQRALKVYIGLKPLLFFLSTFSLLPQMWRTGLTVLTQVLDALAAIGPVVDAQFKAGKDLKPDAEFKAGKDLEPAA